MLFTTALLNLLAKRGLPLPHFNFIFIFYVNHSGIDIALRIEVCFTNENNVGNIVGGYQNNRDFDSQIYIVSISISEILEVQNWKHCSESAKSDMVRRPIRCLIQTFLNRLIVGTKQLG